MIAGAHDVGGAAIGAPAAPCSVVDAGTLVVAGALQSEGRRKTVRNCARPPRPAPSRGPMAAEIGRPGRRAVATSRAMRVSWFELPASVPAWVARHAASRPRQKVVLFRLAVSKEQVCWTRYRSEFRGVRAGAAGFHALRSSWITRGSADYPFYTVGAASYIDAVQGTKPPRYSETSVGPIRCCGSICLADARVMNSCPCICRRWAHGGRLALPGFHVWQDERPTSSLSIHFDLQYLMYLADVARSDHSRRCRSRCRSRCPGAAGGSTPGTSASRSSGPVAGQQVRGTSRRSRSPGRDVSPFTRACSCSFRPHAAPDRGGRSGIILKTSGSTMQGTRSLLRRRVDDLLVRTSRPTSLASLPGGVDQARVNVSGSVDRCSRGRT